MKNKNYDRIFREEEIFKITNMVSGDFELQEVLNKLAETAVRITAVKACSIRLLDSDQQELEMCTHYGLSEGYRNKGKVSKNDPIIKAAFEGEAAVIDDMQEDNRVRYQVAAKDDGLVSQLTVAMKYRKKAIGVLRLYRGEKKGFDQDDVTLARMVANQCAVAISNARLLSEAIEGAQMAEQMRLAGIIQRRMIPQEPPIISGLDIAAIYNPCYQVGGDLYDFIKLDENRVVIAIADVMGKGMPSAMMMGLFRGALRAYADGDCGGNTIESIVAKLNKAACRDCRNGEFITMFIGMVDTANMKLTYCNCGHEPTILLRDDNTIDLEEGGLVLGIVENPEYNVNTIKLKPNDTFLFYTDGLIDAVNFDDRFWGRGRMLQVLREVSNEQAEIMVRDMLRYRRRFVGLARQLDDTSVVIVKVTKK